MFIMSNILLLLVLKKTNNKNAINFFLRNLNFFKIAFLKRKITVFEFKTYTKFLLKKKKVYFLK